jgi:hypothetical protein
VLDGSFGLFNEFFETHEHEAPEGGWSLRNNHHYTDSQLQWFFDRGCSWIKVEAGPGDVILWDSRTIHYGAEAKGETPRVATCEQYFAINRDTAECETDVCYKPAGDALPETYQTRQEAFRDMDNTVGKCQASASTQLTYEDARSLVRQENRKPLLWQAHRR